ncbi:alpha/beta hydrolase [Actinophytocola sp. NPDC049390]|uniref:alpha/beta hydrolase n=1 Tax=Actinophytocola sp. NPDC049390 TaxID=3363894 RepID=UPI0037941B5E
MKRVTVLLSAVLLTGLVTGTATAAPRPDWQACEPGSPVECATITVPIDYAHPETGMIDVAVARQRATGERQGTLVFMPGGPGDSGVSRLLRGNVVPAEVAERFDVVSFDPRGTNRSHPVTCDTDLVMNLPNVVPEAGARLADVRTYARALGDSCRAHTGPLLDHVDSVSVARDIDVLRAALGERKVTLYGRSYGTLAGQMYAENFPHRVRGIVLDSVFNHGLTSSTFITTQVAAGEDAFTAFADWCADDATCALHGQDVGQVYRDLWEKSVRGDLPVPPMALNQNTLNKFYGPDWAGLAEQLKGLTGARTTADTAPFPVGAFCADHRVRFSSQGEWLSLWRRQNAVAPTMRTHFAWTLVSLCSAWPAETPNPQHRTDADDAPPILVMNSLHDPATSHEWARDVHRQLDDSVLLTYDGAGHGVMNRTDCTRAVFTDYVLDRELPRPGTHCPAG